MQRPLILGITGGSGSGKSWLAQTVCQRFGPEQACRLEIDWYYRDLSELDREIAAQTDFDQPDALELDLLEEHLKSLLAGRPVEAPQYDFSRFSRREETRLIEPRPLVVVDGLFTLCREGIASLCDLSVFVDTPADIRLLRRIRRDLAERGYELERILSFWENYAFPSFNAHVLPQKERASLIWRSLEDRAFVPAFLADLQNRLARNAKQPTPPR